MSHTVLLVYAHPERTSLTRTLVDAAKSELLSSGHHVLESDLYAMRWKAAFDAEDFPVRKDVSRLSFVAESRAAYASGTETTDVEQEQAKLAQADAVLFVFPLWWFSFPAILKGWVDRVFAYGLAYGFRDAGNRHRYGEGGFSGKRALLGVLAGGPMADYGARGINGSLEQILFPITHGTLFFSGMQVLPTFAIYGTGSILPEEVDRARETWLHRVRALFTEAPIPFRPQNGGDYPDRHQLAPEIAPGLQGNLAHVADPDRFL